MLKKRIVAMGTNSRVATLTAIQEDGASAELVRAAARLNAAQQSGLAEWLAHSTPLVGGGGNHSLLGGAYKGGTE